MTFSIKLLNIFYQLLSMGENFCISFFKSIGMSISTIGKYSIRKFYKFFGNRFFMFQVRNYKRNQFHKDICLQGPYSSRFFIVFWLQERNGTTKFEKQPIKKVFVCVADFKADIENFVRSIFAMIMFYSKTTFSINKSSKVSIISINPINRLRNNISPFDGNHIFFNMISFMANESFIINKSLSMFNCINCQRTIIIFFNMISKFQKKMTFSMFCNQKVLYFFNKINTFFIFYSPYMNNFLIRSFKLFPYSASKIFFKPCNNIRIYAANLYRIFIGCSFRGIIRSHIQTAISIYISSGISELKFIHY